MRPFCLKELRWATEAGVHIQPVVAAEDKEKIGQFFPMIPEDLQHLGGVNWEHIDRKDSDYFELGVTKIINAAMGDDPEPEPDQEPEPDAAQGPLWTTCLDRPYAVSYTHLTLPTILLV